MAFRFGERRERSKQEGHGTACKDEYFFTTETRRAQSCTEIIILVWRIAPNQKSFPL
jgi:hypothetical protein